MPTNNTQQVEQLAWEGVVSGSTAIALAIVIALLAAWSLWRERDVVGRGWAALFYVLRMVAFGVALWMLAGPTMKQIERTTIAQSIAIFADGSDSMEVVDPPEPTDSLRWRLAIDPSEDDSAVRRCDRMNVALGNALAESLRLSEMVQAHQPPKQLSTVLTSLAAAVVRAATHAKALVTVVNGGDDDLSDRAERIVALVEGPVEDSIAAMGAALAVPDRVLDEDFAVRLEQFADSVSSARRRASVLAEDLAAAEASQTAEGRAEIDGLTRREKAGRALDALEDELGGKLAEGVQIDRFRFDRAAAPVAASGGWAQALVSLTAEERGTPVVEEAALNPPEGAAAVTGPSTNLTAVLQQLATRQSGDATRFAVVLSDGRHNDVDAPPPQEVAAQLAGLPVYVVPIGNSVQMRDVLLHRVEAPAAVAEKDSAVIDVIVTGFDCDGQASSVVLRREGREVDRKPIEFVGGRGDQRVRFMVAAKDVGWQEYVVEVEQVDEEMNTANNFQPVSFEVVRDRTQVLMADGVARWEYRYLNQLFRRDERMTYNELLFYPRLHGTGRLAEQPAFPRDVEGWSEYDVVILGDVTPAQLSTESQHALTEFVRTRGGNLIVIAGVNGMPKAFQGEPLLELLPVERSQDVFSQQGYSLRLTEDGRVHSALSLADSASDSRDEWQRVYDRFPVFELSEFCKPKSTARTLIEAVSKATGAVAEGGTDGSVEHAFLCWQRVGAGRVAYLAAPDTYRLRWRRGDRLHHLFWGQFLRWITATSTGVGSDVVRLQTDRTRYAAGEPVEVTAWLKDATGRPLADQQIQVEARTFDNTAKSTELTPDPDVPGRYFGTLSDLATGAYQIGVRGRIVDELLPPDGDAKPASATITIRATDSIESLNTQCNRALLEQVAQLTGGQVIPPTAISEVFELMSFTPQVRERIDRMPLWNRWSNLFIVLGCLFTEWIVRKSKGLV